MKDMADPTGQWGKHGSATAHRRYRVPAESRARKRCPCCGRRAAWRGMANGVALVSGCEWSMARWVKFGPMTAIHHREVRR